MNFYRVTAITPDDDNIEHYVRAEDEDVAILHWGTLFLMGAKTVEEIFSVFDDTVEIELLRAAPGEPAGLIDDKLIEQVCRAAIIAAKF
ncbi:hypothetical protein ACQVP2_08620 [Methylobacterium aquaticum]|uniref:hypothetical protein n=1 Tax=Methylobacterium aquaticum TaxID=270351 RepID=UPI003D1847E5